jgi:L-threonylcarbamoyladenylate synthase
MAPILPPTKAAIIEASERLRAGRLVAFPTETVYGLGGLATDPTAVAAIFRAKGRPAHNPLIIHLAEMAPVGELAHLDRRAVRLAEAFWPGPLTLVLNARPGSPIVAAATAGLDTVAVRVPAHPVAHALLSHLGQPVAAPSANPSGRLSPTTAAHVATDLGEHLDLVLDGGACPLGVESTVIDLSMPGTAHLLRPGGLPIQELERIVGPLAVAEGTISPRSPGQLASHYAPRLPLRLDAVDVATDEALLAFGPNFPATAGPMRNLSRTGDLAEAARNLFAMLRELDRSGASRIAAMPIPAEGLGLAILDRLRRAAAPRG